LNNENRSFLAVFSFSSYSKNIEVHYMLVLMTVKRNKMNFFLTIEAQEKKKRIE